jgi:hypothetical protein
MEFSESVKFSADLAEEAAPALRGISNSGYDRDYSKIIRAAPSGDTDRSAVDSRTSRLGPNQA